MPRILVTGMSGVGKSTALTELARRRHRVVETDDDSWWTEVVTSADGPERVWREDRIAALLSGHRDDAGALFVSGTVRNQGRFYPRFDAVVLLSAPLDVMLDRIASRTTNDFGRSNEERDRIVRDAAAVEPLLRAGATAEIDTRVPLEEVVLELERIAGVSP
jgi:adenylate kinase family enzyme